MAGYLSPLEDRAAGRFYEELEAGRFATTRCRDCDYTFFPPRILCPHCLGAGLEWVGLSGLGTLYAFSQQHGAILHRKPEVVGAVDLVDAEGRVFSLIDAPFDELQIGMRVEVSLFESPLGMTLHRFSPVRPS